MVRVDQGDGTFREQEQCTTKYREEPVYADWCTYTVDRWEYERDLRASGNSLDEAPHWPETNNLQSNERILEPEKDAKVEHYVVYLKATDSDKTYECDYDQDRWATIPVESVWQLEVKRAGSPVCSSLKKSD